MIFKQTIIAAATFAVLLSSPFAYAKENQDPDAAHCVFGYAPPKDDLQQRIDACTRVIKKGLNAGKGYEVSWALNTRGTLNIDSGKKVLAFTDFNDAIRYDKNQTYAYVNRGNLYFDDKDYDRALEDFTRQLAIDPKRKEDSVSASAHNGIGKVLATKRQCEQAIVEFTKAIDLSANVESYWWRRGDAYYGCKKYDQATADFSKAIDLEASADNYWRRGYTLQKLDRWNDAASDFARVAEMQPQNGRALNQQAWSLVHAGKSAEALPVVQKALALLPKDANTIDTLAHVYEALERKDEAILEYRRALSIKPDLQESKDGLKRLGVE